MPRKYTRYTLVDNIKYFTVVFYLFLSHGSYFSTPLPPVGHSGVSSFFEQSFGSCHVINTIDLHEKICVWTHKCTTYHRYRQPPTQRQKDMKNKSARSSWPGSCNLQEHGVCYHEHWKLQPFILRLFGIWITSQINGYTRTDWILSMTKPEPEPAALFSLWTDAQSRLSEPSLEEHSLWWLGISGCFLNVSI